MTTRTAAFIQPYLKPSVPDILPGDTVRVHQRIKEGAKERVQVFEGVVLARKHGRGINATITVRKVSQGVGVERIFPLHSPVVEKIEVAKRAKVRRAKLGYLRGATGKRARLKERKKEIREIVFRQEASSEPEPREQDTAEQAEEARSS